MKKKITVLFIIFLFILIGFYCIDNYNNKNKVLLNEHISRIVKDSSISMMYETEYQSGIYQESTDSSFPREGYIFNSALSKCENGSKLEYDEATGKVMMYANMSDKCYVYFDVYTLPAILSIERAGSGLNYITLSVNATSGSAPIENYYYSINSGVSWEISTENTYTFYGLSSGTSYDFLVYVADSNKMNSKKESFTASTGVCFLAGTKVHTDKGYKNIEEIVIGDKVYSYNEESKVIELKKVNKTYIRKTDKIYEIKVGNSVIETTSEHRFFAKTKYDTKGKWISVKNLTKEHYLYTLYGKLEKIKNITLKEDDFTVYNLEINDNHTYYVSYDNYLVHNAYADP